MNTKIVNSQEVKRAVIAGYKNHWRFRVLEQDGVPEQPLYWNGFWFDTLKSDSIIPTEGLKRLKILEKEGIKVKALVVGHEAPKLLGGPVAPPKPLIDTEKVMEAVSTALPIVGTVLAALVTFLMVVAAGAATVFAVLGIVFVRAILIDPILVVVLEDGTWLEVMTWYD